MPTRTHACSRLQAKRFFAALCYTNQNISLFERQLVDLPEKDWATVLLASIMIDNSGIAKAREDLMRIVAETGPEHNGASEKNALVSCVAGLSSSLGTSLSPSARSTSSMSAGSHSNSIDDEKNLGSYHHSGAGEYWIELPNQYIFQNRAWLYPVIRACDPERTTFTDDDYGSRLLETLSDQLSIKLKCQNDTVFVELKHSLDVISLLIAEPEITGASEAEIDGVMSAALTEGVFKAVKHSALVTDRKGHGLSLQEKEELSKGLIVLVIMTLLFAATGLLFGFFCITTDQDHRTVINMVS